MKPQFSIITCTYNSEKYIKECIRSVEKQTFKNYEHIFIDAYSKDKTIDIIKKYQKKNTKKIKLYFLKPKGISNAMNEGIIRSNGIYICHLHSDDYFNTEKSLEIIHDTIKKTKSNLIVGVTAKKIENKNKITTLKKISKIKQKSLFFENYISHQNTFIKKSLFEKYGMFDETFKLCMDYDFILRLLKNKEQPTYINKNISIFRVHEDSISASHKHIKEILIEDYRARKKNTKYYVPYEILSLINKTLRQLNRWIR